MMPSRRIHATTLARVSGRSTVIAIAIALLVGGARTLLPRSSALAVAVRGESSLSRHDAMARPEPVHATVAVVPRVATELTGDRHGGVRLLAVTDAAHISTHSAASPGTLVDARSRGVPSPGLPAASSRAPPAS